MAGIIQLLQKFLKPYYNIITIVIIAIIFILVGYYAFSYYGKPTIQDSKFKDVANKNQRKKQVEIYFFWASWCPHCTTAKPEWEKFQQEYNKKALNGYEINCMSIQCDNENNAETEKFNERNGHLMEVFKVDSFPTVKMVLNGDETIDFDSKITKNTLDTFVNTVITE